MGCILKLIAVIALSLPFMACSSAKKKPPMHSTDNYKRIDRFPSSGEHAPIMEHVLDRNLYDACRRERSEQYCRRRLGTWRQ